MTLHLFADIFGWFTELRDERGFDFSAAPAGAKALKEAKELVDHPSLEECADVIIAACGAAFTLGHDSRELHHAVREKMVINRNRAWELQEDGTYQHVGSR